MQDRAVMVVLGQMDVTRVNPYRFGHCEPPAQMAWFAPNRIVALPGGGSRSASLPEDDVHQTRITEGVWGWERTNRGMVL